MISQLLYKKIQKGPKNYFYQSQEHSQTQISLLFFSWASSSTHILTSHRVMTQKLCSNPKFSLQIHISNYISNTYVSGAPQIQEIPPSHNLKIQRILSISIILPETGVIPNSSIQLLSPPYAIYCSHLFNGTVPLAKACISLRLLSRLTQLPVFRITPQTPLYFCQRF